MPLDRTPVTFPRLFSPPLPGVVSPLTCRHPKHLRCACHGEHTTATASAAPRTQSAAGKQPDTAAAGLRKAYAAAINQLKRYYMDLLAEIVEVVRGFPDAAVALEAKLRSGADTEPEQPEFAL